MWGVQLILVNAYVLYKTSHLLIWKIAKSKLLSQYQFRKSVVLEWFGLQDKESEEVTSEKSSENSRKRTRCSTSKLFLSLEEASTSKRATRETEQMLDTAMRIKQVCQFLKNVSLNKQLNVECAPLK